MKIKTAWICGAIGFFLIAGFIGAAIYDSPAPKIRYSVKDLEVPEEVATSYETLMRYRSNGTNRVEIALPDDILRLAGTWDNLRPHSDKIEAAWDGCIEGRRYIHDLDQFPYITDWDNARGQLNLLTNSLPDYQTMRNITLLYGLRASLLTQQHQPGEAVTKLTQHYSVIRKSLPYSTTLVTFAVNVACAKLDVQIAELMIRSGECSPAELQRMKQTFKPLSKEEYSWFRPLLAEYAYSQYMVTLIEKNDPAAITLFDSAPLGRIIISKNVLFKPNQTMRSFKHIYEPLIDACFQREDLRPTMIKIQKSIRNNDSESKLWNPDGQQLVDMMIPVWQNVYDKTIELKIMHDLLALEIDEKLGKTLDISDPYSGDVYRFDESNDRFYSVGPDGIDGTNDDIYINNPNLLQRN